jgi:hypothetical protein
LFFLGSKSKSISKLSRYGLFFFLSMIALAISEYFVSKTHVERIVQDLVLMNNIYAFIKLQQLSLYNSRELILIQEYV